jgi:two-component system chemotaxis response regulator CheY
MSGIRALIVDDSSVMRKVIERCLQQSGIDVGQVYNASNGMEGLAVINQNAVDLVLTDINMPVMDGLEFVRQLQAMDNAKNIPVVMITTEGGEKQVIEALSLGAKGYIRKPFTPDQLREQVAPILGRSS